MVERVAAAAGVLQQSNRQYSFNSSRMQSYSILLSVFVRHRSAIPTATEFSWRCTYETV